VRGGSGQVSQQSWWKIGKTARFIQSIQYLVKMKDQYSMAEY
jgi:hypothetical protein